MHLIKSIVSFDPLQDSLLTQQVEASMQPSVLLVLTFILLQNSQFVLLHPVLFFSSHFLTFKPQVTPKPKISVF